jgi:hypothetical protein
LKYAQISKRREKGRVVEVLQRIIFGKQEEVMDSTITLIVADGEEDSREGFSH